MKGNSRCAELEVASAPAAAAGSAGACAGLLGSAALALAALFWAGNYAVGRVVADEITPATLNLLRWTVAICFLLPFSVSRLAACRQVVSRNFPWFLRMALSAVVIHPTVVYAALGMTTATNLALIIAGTPAMMLILSALLYGERHGPFRIAVVALSFLGIALLVWNNLSAPNTGDLMGCFAMTFWAYYNVALRDCPAEVDSITLTTIISIIGVFILLPLSVVELTLGGGVEFTPEILLSILYVGMFASGIAYLLWNAGIAAIGANHAAQFMNLVPVFGVLIGTFILDEAFTPRHGLAASLILSALLLSELQRRAAA